LPGFAGEVDLVKSLQSVPGIKTYGDGSTLFYVRGGNRDQNLILVDEAPIFNPSHLFGFFSALAPDAINDAEVYKGDFPSGFGGKLSSVIDIKVKEGNMKRIGFGGSLGPYTSNLSFEGPLKKEKCSFFISARNSNLNWLMSSKVTERSFKINFFDVNTKLNFKLNDNNRFFVSAYGGQDDFTRIAASTYNTYGIKWNNLLGSLRWNHIYNSKLFSNSTIYYSRYNYFLYVSKELDDYWKSSIDNMAFKTDFTYYLNPNNTLKAGINISRYTSNPGNVNFSDAEIQRRAPVIPKYISMEYDLYISNQQTIGDKIILNYGLRLPVWQNFGATTFYSFNDEYQVTDTTNYKKNIPYITYFSPEPRLSLKYLVSKKTSLQIGYSRTSQFIQILSNSVSPFTSLEVWVPCGPNIKPQTADQFTAGYFQSLFKSKFNLSAEIFYKQLYNQIEYKDHADLLFNPQLEGELRFGKGWSYGIELMFSKPQGNFTGWISYTYSRALMKIDGVNNNDIYPAFYDSPNNVNINLSYSLKRWLFSTSWIYLTGNAITTPVAFYYYNGYTIPIYGNKNNDRLPDYHRLDFSITYRINKPERRFQHSIMLSVYNAYARNNPISINFNKIVDSNGKIVIPADLNGNYELVPTKMYVAGIIPSINYKFKF
jgi:outer membrane cobalamin receptor